MLHEMLSLLRQRPAHAPIVVLGVDEACAQWQSINLPQASAPGQAPGPGRRTMWDMVNTPVRPLLDVHELSNHLATPRETSHDHGEIVPCRGLPRSRPLPLVHGWGLTATRVHRLMRISGTDV